MEGDPRVIVGTVLANGGDTPRKASTIKYTISWAIGAGGPIVQTDTTPDDDRPPDQVNGKDLETIPLRVETAEIPSKVFGAIVGDTIVYWAAHERPAMSECEQQGAGRSGRILRDAQGNIINQPGGGGQNQGGGGPPGGGVGGGGVVTR